MTDFFQSLLTTLEKSSVVIMASINMPNLVQITNNPKLLLEKENYPIILVFFTILVSTILTLRFLLSSRSTRKSLSQILFCGLPGSGKTRLISSFVQNKSLDKVFTVPSMELFEYKINIPTSIQTTQKSGKGADTPLKTKPLNIIDIPSLAKYNTSFTKYLEDGNVKALVFLIDSEKADPLAVAVDDIHDEDISNSMDLDVDIDSPNERMISLATQLRTILTHANFKDTTKLYFICNKSDSLNALPMSDIQDYLEKALTIIEKNLANSVTIGVQNSLSSSTANVTAVAAKETPFLAEPDTPVKFDNLVWDYEFIALPSNSTHVDVSNLFTKFL